MSKTRNRLAEQRQEAINRASQKTKFWNRDLLMSRWNNRVPQFAHEAVFPHWQDESAVTLRQIIEWAADDIDWLLTRARCERTTFYRIAYGVISDTDVSVDWWNETAANLNAAVSDMQRQRVRDLEALKNVSTYWSDIEGASAPDEATPDNVIRLMPRETAGGDV